MTKAIQIAIIVVCFAAAGILLWRHFTAERPGDGEGPHMDFFICSNPDCAREYAVEPGAKLDGRDPDVCPECGSPAARAARCPSCGRFHQLVGHGRYLPNCPHCGAPMPPLVEQLRDGKRKLGG